MHVCQITYSGFGGLGSVVFSLISADQAHKHDWSIGFIGDLPLDASYPKLCQEHQVKYTSFRSTPGRPYRAWIALSCWLGSVKPDVVIFHSINSILACRWYASRHGARLIAVEHTPNQVKTRSEFVASLLSMLVADRVVVLTDEYREELRKAHGWLYRPDKIRVIPNGIDASLFSPGLAKPLTKVSRIRLGMAARFSFSKRQDLLVDAMLKLANMRTDFSFELRFAGNGEDFERVKALASNSPLAPHIHFDGLLNEQEVADWLRGLDVYVHATDGETLSTSLLQAMATGLPIVASDIPGVRNLLVKHEDYGLCIPNEADSFANAIASLIESTARRENLSARARQRILDKYSNAAMLRSYLEILD